MKAWKAIRGQLVDFYVYLALPMVSVFLPAAWSRALLARSSGFSWVLSSEAGAALASASDFVDTGDRSVWKARWKQVEMLDVRDTYLMSFGRTRSVLAETECETDIEDVRDKVLIGMHWGPSISILKILQTAGLNPALPFRRPEKQILRVRPFFYFYVTLAARHIVKTMGERAVPIGGAGKALRAMMDQPGSVIVVMDAPPRKDRPTLSATVLGKNAVFEAGFPGILADNKKQYFLYALSLQPGGLVRKKLELEGPYCADDAQEFLHNYAGFLDRHLSSDPAQWRIWHVARQFWPEP
ncbi:MAG: hypothetical protein WBS20_12020 [Lysobacterales bacterium]